ncbi:hypothetical protein CSAL01_01923 [Colletotrichum salicis]|uniref:Uncharacterized protein n=1 Tax=Colletotrichum salicis TaxID=1209931 RepID=A0A135TYQ4_9PEZI|nr:hypothetical protein CSAL01_01923 [Colletotrichum salicis]
MCQPTDPYCWYRPDPLESLESKDSLDSLDKPVLYICGRTPLKILAESRGNELPLSPAGLSRVLFFPKHTSRVTHLPIYEVSNTYNEAVKDAPLGSGMYKINMMFMRRPKGDGTDSNVEFFIDVAPDQSFVTIQQRSVVLNEGLAIRITLPTEQQEESVLEVFSLGTFNVRVSRFQPTRMNKSKPSLSTFRQYPALSMVSKDHPGMQWQLRPQDPGSLCYYLTENDQSNADGGTEPPVFAVYHYAGGHPHHPVDHSEGVLLLPETRDSRREMVAIALVFLLLWHMRDLDCPRENTSLSKVLGKFGLRK